MWNTAWMRRTILAACVALFAMSEAVVADEPEVGPGGLRWEVWLGISSWPALGELQPEAGGDFDELGFGLGGALHWPVAQYENSELMLGFDASIDAIDSSIPGIYDNQLERHMYLGSSVKWLLGESRNFSVDAGIGYHLVNIVQINTNIFLDSVEHEIWEKSAPGAFIGASWDIAAARPGRRRGLSLGLKVHFADLGIVRDEDIPFAPILGTNAGTLDGPLYIFQVGYSGR